MTKKEQDESENAMRKLNPEEMLNVNPKDYMGECERVGYYTRQDANCFIPTPILELEDDELIKRYIEKWEDTEIDMDCDPSY